MSSSDERIRDGERQERHDCRRDTERVDEQERKSESKARDRTSEEVAERIAEADNCRQQCFSSLGISGVRYGTGDQGHIRLIQTVRGETGQRF